MKLEKRIIIHGEILLITGMHIGGSKSSLDIGGVDNNVIKTAHGVPYIPGSSLKGKLRSMLAREAGSKDVNEDVEKHSHIADLFGSPGEKDNSTLTRLYVRDAYLNKEEFKNNFKRELDFEFSEMKTENSIDRLKGSAKGGGGIRHIERVPAGSMFNFELVLNIFDDDDERKLIDNIVKSMKMLEHDYLGGNGSRGYGQIVFGNIKTSVFGLNGNQYEKVNGGAEVQKFRAFNFLENAESGE